MDDLLQQGITAYKAGKRDEARNIFITTVKQSPDSERAWGWLYQVSNNDQERIHCLKQILRINPKNEKASQSLNQLLDPFTSDAPLSSTPSITRSSSPTPVSPSKQVNSFGNAQKKGNNSLRIASVAISLIFICVIIPIGGYFVYDSTRTIPNAEVNPNSETFIQTTIAQTQSALPTNTPSPIPATRTLRPTNTPQLIIEPNDMLSYMNKVSPLVNSLVLTMNEFTNESIQIGNNHDLYYDQAWRSQVNATLDKFLAFANGIESIESVPQQAKKLDGYLDQIASEIRMLVSNYKLFLDGGDSTDQTYLYMTAANIDRITNLIILANEEVKGLSNP
jgi:hypothetical protein